VPCFSHELFLNLVLAVIPACCGALVSAAPREPAAGTPGHVQITGPTTKNGIQTYVVTSDYQEKPCSLYVLLPDRFDKAKRYKVLYVLPAWAPSPEGIREMQKLDAANKYDLICVGPDFSGMPWYVDNETNPKIRCDSYIPEVIVPLVDKLFPTIARPDGRLLIGYSKAGMGAVSLLLRHADVFGRAGSWDGIIMMQNRPEFYGSREHFAQYYVPNLMRRQAAVFRDQPARIAIAGYGDLRRDGDDAHALLKELGIPHFFDNSVKRRHEWTSGWVAPLIQVLMADDMAALNGSTLFAPTADAKPAPSAR
jgi:hypothetical protein